jgi:hypothetical protein
LVTAGRGATGTVQFVAASASADGKLGVVYLPVGGDITLSLAKFRGAVNARWFDPLSGAFSPIAGSPFAAGSMQKLTAPGSTDTALLLEAM